MAGVKDEIAKNILYYRKKCGLTQKALADHLGVKHNAISAWENGANSIDMDTLFNMCRIFKISVSEVFGIYGRTENEVNSFEMELIRRYRQLDTYGQETISYLLDRELGRIENTSNRSSEPHVLTNKEMEEIWKEAPKTPEELERLYPPVDYKGIKEIG